MYGFTMSRVSSIRGNVSVYDCYRPSYQYQQDLLRAKNLEDVISVILKISQEISFTAFRLFSYDRVSETRSVMSEWYQRKALSTASTTCCFDGCKSCWADSTAPQEIIVSNRCGTCIGPQQIFPRFCLPLFISEREAVFLHFYLSDDASLGPSHLNLIEELAPMIARSYQTIHQKQELDRLAEASIYEKLEVARYLHDSLSHNLAYLRLKLELISLQACDNKHHQEADHLVHIVDRCYVNVRDLLSHLLEVENTDSWALFEEYIKQLRESVDFQINLTVQGQPKTLPPKVRMSIYHILHEIIHNVATHARASSVNVSINCEKESISLEVSDDGCGFNPNAVKKRRGHFGLRIIRKYVEEGQGELSVSSCSGSGTKISIQLPVKKKN
jgi:nitrate/nitrite-specific signal transduction histidine kinase